MFSVHIERTGEKDIRDKAMKWQKFAQSGKRLAVGIFPESTTLDGQYVAEYATYNEYGTATIPARPFLRQTVDAHQKEWAQIVAARASADPDDIEAGYILAGEVASKDVMSMIESGQFVPNAEATVERKRAAGKKQPETPLIDTGTMLEAISYKIETGGGA